jgi:Ran GTPase-activating protein 1
MWCGDVFPLPIAMAGTPTVLHQFEIHNNCLTDDGALSLAPLLAASPQLRALRFTTTRVGEKGGAALVQALVTAGCKQWESLELADNSIGPKAGAVFVEGLLKAAGGQPKLKALNIGDTGFGSKALSAALEALHKTAPELHTLDLNNLEIDAKLSLKV